MGRLNTFEIFVLNQYSEVPYGSTLRGQIVIDCPDDMEVTEISVHCYGKCRVELFDYRISAASLIDAHGTGIAPWVVNDTIMHKAAVCFPTDQPPECSSELDNSTDPPTQHNNNVLPKGMHVFDFSIDIPQWYPASFEGEYGYIRYFMRAHVQCPHSIEYNVRNFKVVPVLDLNCLPDVEAAVEEEMEEEIYSFFKSIGTYRAKMSLHKTGYVPGDVLHVHLDIHNDTQKDITRATLKLKMVTTYRSQLQSRRTEMILCTSKLSPIDAGYTFHGCDRNLRIPKDVTISNAYNYRYIYIEYFVELSMQPSFLSLDQLKMSAKIELGTVPIATERLMASLVLREPPPRYEDLLPRYEDAITSLAHKAIAPADDALEEPSCSREMASPHENSTDDLHSSVSEVTAQADSRTTE